MGVRLDFIAAFSRTLQICRSNKGMYNRFSGFLVNKVVYKILVVEPRIALYSTTYPCERTETVCRHVRQHTYNSP